jgi:uncharacterized protein YdeI (YjbR/CyaY-like superfamily)
VHAGCPEVEETLKWSAPHFMYKGMLGGMAAFKHHCTFGFWKGALLVGKPGGISRSAEAAMGQFGRITSIADLPSEKKMVQLVKKAAALNDQGVKLPARRTSSGKGALRAPVYLLTALRRNRKALATFQGFSPSHKRAYVEWVTGAKSEETRARRIATAVAWMAEGKTHNWKYVRT